VCMKEELLEVTAPSVATHLGALLRVLRAISVHRDTKQLFRALAGEMRHVVDFDFMGLFLYDESANKVEVPVLESRQGSGFVLPPDFPPEATLTWWVYHHQEPVVISSREEETRFPRVMELYRRFGVQSSCVLPLTTAHRRLGSLAFAIGQSNVYSEEQIPYLSLVADQVALAVDNALHSEASDRAQTELRREKERLELLLDLNNSIISNLELRSLLRAISASVRRVMHSDAVGVNLPDPETGELRIYAHDFPGAKGFLREGMSRPPDSLPGRVFSTGKPASSNAQQLAALNPEAELYRGEGLNSSCFLPLISRDRVLGVLGLSRVDATSFSHDDVQFLMQVANQVALAVENALAYGQIAELKDKLAQEKLYLEDEIRTERNFEEIVGKSPALREVLKQVETVAPTDSTVLIVGETGTGKELIARAIHNLSPRRPNAFVKLNCAAIPMGLLESELFGHEKGAFTGAIAQRVGRFELAHRGTIFLDEIGEVPPELQPKLLRVLQEREFERLGSPRTLRTDARLIAATNRDLAVMVDEQKFRSDLFYRLNVFPIRVPPLRERPEDIPLLVRHFAEVYSRRLAKSVERIPSESMRALVQYEWPGNVRELQNVIERAVILSTGPVLNVAASDLKGRSTANGHASKSAESSATRVAPPVIDRDQILHALREAGGRVGGPDGAAARLGLKRTTLIARMNKLGITARIVIHSS